MYRYPQKLKRDPSSVQTRTRGDRASFLQTLATSARTPSYLTLHIQLYKTISNSLFSYRIFWSTDVICIMSFRNTSSSSSISSLSSLFLLLLKNEKKRKRKRKKEKEKEKERETERESSNSIVVYMHVYIDIDTYLYICKYLYIVLV